MDKLLVHWSNIFDDNIFWPLIRVHIANYCRAAIQWIAFHATVHLQWIIYNAHRPFTNHRSFTIAAFSRGAGAISSTENALASEKDLGLEFLLAGKILNCAKKCEKWNQWGIRKCQIWNLSFLLAAQIWNCAKTGHQILNRKCACTNRQENNCSIWIVAENLHCCDLCLMTYLQYGALWPWIGC